MRRILCWVTLLFSIQCFATIFAATPFPDLVKEAPTIVRGVVGTSYTDWVVGQDVSKRIYTFYQLRVKEAFKGDVSADAIVIREMGGEKDGIGMEVAGAAKFIQGEDVVVLLGPRNDDGSYDVWGLSSGKFNLKRQPDGAECLEGLGIAMSGRNADFARDHENRGDQGDTSGQCPWTLADLRKVVHEQAQSAKTDAKSTPSPAVPSVKISPLGSPTISPSPAFRLQPSTAGGTRPVAKTRFWFIVFALGLAGLALILLMKPKS